MSTQTTSSSSDTTTTGARQSQQRGRPFSIAGLVCAVVALFFLPIVLGPVGAVLGFVGYAKGDRMGLWVGIAGIVATIAGMALAYAVLH